MAVLVISLLGAVELTAGFVAAYWLARARAGVPAARWFPDPSVSLPRDRWWDARAWTPQVQPGDTAANRGHRFRGRFWGGWIGILLGGIAILLAGSAAYRASGAVNVMALTSLLGMAAICWAFYRFVARQLALGDVIGPSEVIAVAIATAGAVLVIAANVNGIILDAAGIRVGTLTVGVVEEGTKLLVPLALFALGRYRDPRAGIAIGLAAGFGFAVAETTQYAYTTANASGPGFCGNDTGPPTVGEVVQAQAYRMFTVSPLHWLWTGIAVTIAWRLWHLYGRRGTPGAVAAIVMVMVIHSVNDTSATLGCDNAAVSWLAQLFRWALLIAMYLVFKAVARKSTPPQLIGVVSKGWTPRRLTPR